MIFFRINFVVGIGLNATFQLVKIVNSEMSYGFLARHEESYNDKVQSRGVEVQLSSSQRQYIYCDLILLPNIHFHMNFSLIKFERKLGPYKHTLLCYASYIDELRFYC